MCARIEIITCRSSGLKTWKRGPSEMWWPVTPEFGTNLRRLLKSVVSFDDSPDNTEIQCWENYYQCILGLLGNSRNYREENFVNKSHALEGVRYVLPETNVVCENTSEGGFVT